MELKVLGGMALRMKDLDKGKNQLMNELVELRQRIAELEARVREHKCSEETLQEYQKVIESSQDMVAVVDQHYHYILANAGFLKYRGLSREQVIGRSAQEVLGKDVFEKVVKKNLDACFRGKVVQYEMKYVYPTLGERDLLVQYFPIENPKGIDRVVCVIRDITDRKQMERALRESEQRFRSLVETTSDWVWEVDEHDFYTYASPKVKDLLGYDPEEVIGKKPFDLMPLEEADRIAKLFRDIVKLRKPFTRLENTNVHKEGHLVVLETSGVPIFGKDGNYAGYRGIDRNITERVRAEADRKGLEARIQRMKKMEALGTLAGGVAHDLNNILSGIVGYPDLILMQLPDNSPLRESILAIKRSGLKAAEVVQDLLTLARRGMVSMEIMNLNSVISDYMNSPEQEKIQSFHPNVRFEVLLKSDLLPVKGSRVHLSKTVMNLISNAAEAIPETGVVTISTKNQYLDRAVKGYDDMKEGDYVVLEVSDTGKGISTEDMARIFEPFYTKKAMGRSGTGLGLAVVWGSVKDHDGYIDVQSEEGRGTKFSLYLPVTREVLTLNQPPISVSGYMGKGETILVVDDVREQRELAVTMLSKLNYQAISVPGGEAAIEYMKTRGVDLLILDMILDPGMDGLETYRRILELHPAQKAIIVSGFSETERVRQALGLGAGAFVMKPYVLEKIGQVVRRELDRCSPST